MTGAKDPAGKLGAAIAYVTTHLSGAPKEPGVLTRAGLLPAELTVTDLSALCAALVVLGAEIAREGEHATDGQVPASEIVQRVATRLAP